MIHTWDSIFGQSNATEWLRQAYAAARLPHALIFAGPVGVGKGTVAEALAALFLCPDAKNLQPCGHCESCRIMAAGTHPDFHRVTRDLIRYHDKAGKSKGIDLSIKVVRAELVEPANRRSSMGVGKVFLVEEADTMNAAAQNAMLKTLEEPEGRTLIVLLTDQPGALLPTIRSRCQLVQFAALPVERVEKELIDRGFDAAESARAAALSNGSLGVALRWIEDGVIAPAVELLERIDALGEASSAAAAEDALGNLPAWMVQAAAAYSEKQIERDPLGSKDAATRNGMAIYLLLMGNHIRKSLTALDIPRMERTCAWIDDLVQTQKYLEGNVSVPIALQHLTSALASHAQ